MRMSAPAGTTGGAEPLSRTPRGGLRRRSPRRVAGAGILTETVLIDKVLIEPVRIEPVWIGTVWIEPVWIGT
jgi:hypothetical protein